MSDNFKKYCNSIGMRFNLNINRLRTREKEILKDRFDEFDKEQIERSKVTNGEKFSHEYFEKKIFNGIEYMSDKTYGYPINYEESILFMHPDRFFASSSEIIKQIEDLKPKKVLDLGCYNAVLLSFLAQEFPAIQFFGIDREREILSFAQKKFNLSNLHLIGADYENTKDIKSYDCDLIYSCFGYHVDNKFEKYDKPFIRDNLIYNQLKKEYKKFFEFVNTQCSPNTVFIPIISIGTFEDYVAFIDAATENNWNLNFDKTKRLKWFDNAYDATEQTAVSILTKGNEGLKNLSNLIELVENKQLFNLDRALAKYNYENLNKDKIILDSKDITSQDGYNYYLELGHPNASKSSFYCFNYWKTGGAAYFKESDNFEDIEVFLKKIGFSN